MFTLKKIVIVGLISILPSFWAFASEKKIEKIPKTILSFYNPEFYSEPSLTPAHQMMEITLHNLDLKVEYHSFNKPFPQPDEINSVRGILVFFEDKNDVLNPRDFCSWILQRIKEGIKVAILGETAFITDDSNKMSPECLAIFQELGVDYLGQFTSNPYYIQLADKDPEMVEYERRLLLNENLTYSLFKPILPNLKIYLKAHRIDLDQSDSALVFVGPQGGFVHSSYIYYKNIRFQKTHLRINPFLFFKEAFDINKIPVKNFQANPDKVPFKKHVRQISTKNKLE